MSLANPTPTPGPQTVAASYERVSRTIQALGFSLQTQRLGSDEYADRQGWFLPEALRFRDGEDDDASGADWDLPDLLRMLEAARAGLFKVLIVPVHDRLARDMGKAIVVESQLESYGVRVVYINAPDDGSPEGKLLRNNLHAFSQYDRDKRRLLTMMNRRHKARLGLWVGSGLVPYGYRAVRDQRTDRIVALEPDPVEAEVVREIYRRSLRQSSKKVLRWLDETGVTPPGKLRDRKGAPDGWSRSTLRNMLQRPLYAGRGRYGESEIPVPAIVDPEVWQRIRDAIVDRKHKPTGWTKRQALDGGDAYLLRGRLFCGHCTRPGETWPLRTDRTIDHRYYNCQNRYTSRIRHIRPVDYRCPLAGIRAELIEDWVWQVLSEALSNADLVDRGFREAQARRDAELAKSSDRLQAIEREYAKASRTLERTVRRLNELEDDDLERPLLERQRTDQKRILEALKRQRDSIADVAIPSAFSPEQIAQAKAFLSTVRLADASPAEQRELIQMLDVRATVYSATGAEPGAIQVQHKPKRYVLLEFADTVVRLETGRSFFNLRLLSRPWRFELMGIRD